MDVTAIITKVESVAQMLVDFLTKLLAMFTNLAPLVAPIIGMLHGAVVSKA